MPDSDWGEVIKILVNQVFVDNWVLIFLLFISNLFWAVLFKKMKGLYQSEIDRLSEIRSELMHKKNLVSIDEHRSSEGDCEEQYVLPPNRQSPDASKTKKK
ncbi:hypothetical protein CHL67_03490 [Prosthecochloris sp. GSB1]|uniref:hypothetical protein n=1 Tax=Prosthecochloris sp. GSB1 TaxID=281093 RepID=UPI000B8CC7CD|nr:hypothetical protein [Prosthecochloris sp. GSB1]ASQ90113.1 hypothetical protein CHL67_03490 [Prosthecochloris sp. GSB1]